MIDGGDDVFQLFDDVCSGGPVPVATRITINETMKEKGLEWVERWDTPIHKKCLKKMSREHAMATTIRGDVIHFSEKHCRLPRQEESAPQPTPAPERKDVDRAVDSSGPISTSKYTLGKASWLPLPSMKAPSYPKITEASSNKPLKSLEVVQQGKNVKKTTTFKDGKAGPKAALMEKAAAKCAFKLDTWSKHSKHPANSGGGVVVDSRAGSDFKIEEHQRLFDTEFHGPRIRNGVKGYVRYDGVFIPTPHDVNCMHPDGSLTPG